MNTTTLSLPLLATLALTSCGDGVSSILPPPAQTIPLRATPNLILSDTTQPQLLTLLPTLPSKDPIDLVDIDLGDPNLEWIQIDLGAGLGCTQEPFLQTLSPQERAETLPICVTLRANAPLPSGPRTLTVTITQRKHVWTASALYTITPSQQP